jgi:hypothetical protein
MPGSGLTRVWTLGRRIRGQCKSFSANTQLVLCNVTDPVLPSIPDTPSLTCSRPSSLSPTPSPPRPAHPRFVSMSRCTVAVRTWSSARPKQAVMLAYILSVSLGHHRSETGSAISTREDGGVAHGIGMAVTSERMGIYACVIGAHGGFRSATVRRCGARAW